MEIFWSLTPNMNTVGNNTSVSQLSHITAVS